MSSDLAQLRRVGVVGAGAVGSAIARALAARGAHVVAITSRTVAHAQALAESIPSAMAVISADAVAAESETILVAVPDDAIATVAVATHWQAGQLVIHLSGAQGAEALASARALGARIAALHPLMTFPRATQAPAVETILRRLAGCSWAFEAYDEVSVDQCTAIVEALDGRAVRLTAADRAPYHMAAVFASNYIVTLLAVAVRLWGTFGARPETALAALFPLTNAAVEHLESVGLPDALTGPIARGDLGTLRTHLDWLTAHTTLTPELQRLRDAYIALARLTIPVALEQGSLSAETAEALSRLLSDVAAYPLAPPDAQRGGAI
jgi:predicted short-subunit dehydrogenase-like oxidoreductase (DUF2520 family)